MLSPWQTYYNEIRALFGSDPQITTAFDEEKMEIVFRVSDQDKAEALSKIIPFKKMFGNLEVTVTIIPPNEPVFAGATIRKAFEGNPAFEELIEIDDVMSNPIMYALFKKEVVQFWNDNLGDPHGNVTTLYQDIASDILDVPSVMFCTSSNASSNVRKPVG